MGHWQPRLRRFTLAGARYAVRLTDVQVRPWLMGHPEGLYSLQDMGIDSEARIALTISLGDGFQGVHYKLAAAVLRLA